VPRRRRSLSDPVTMRPFPSFVDALAATLLVLVFVITLLSIFSGKVLDEIEGREKAREAQSRLDEDFALLVAAEGMKIEREGAEIRILLPDHLLFDSGDADPSEEGAELLDRLGPHLRSMTRGQIFVEGHTDDRAIRGALAERFPTNWELSTARATRVVRRFVANAEVESGRLTAAGFADTRPLASNETEEGRATNRRIEIRIRP
jgi:chemotaxis protein MotB